MTNKHNILVEYQNQLKAIY